MSELPAEPYYKARRRRLIAATAWALCGTLAVLAGVYGIGRLRSNPADAACQPAVQTAARLAPLVHGEVAALSVAHTGFLVPDLAFKDGAGRDRTLKDWRCRTVLLNLWATWCVPCRKEMPALDALQGKLGSRNFEVVAVNIDTRDPDKPKAFLKDGNLSRLSFFGDQKAKVFQDLKSAGLALGMPTSVLIDGEGCEIAAISGGAGWDSDEAVKLISAAAATPQ